MHKRTIIAIAKKEFFSFINSPLSFVIIVPFLFISSFIYLRTSLIVREASMRSYFELLPWFLILLAPALSMKLLTEERARGTIELLYAHPVSEADIVVGKFFGALGFFLVILATTLPLPFALLAFANPDPGVLIAQYIGGILVGATFLSLGLLASAYVISPIGSFLLSAAGSFVLILLGVDFVTLLFPAPFNRIVEELAVTTHMNTIARGLLDIRDVLYFLTITAVFLTVTIMKLSERKIQEDAREKRKLTVALALVVGTGILINLFMAWYPIRLDITQQKLFTLSAGTKQTLQKLPDLVSITVYAYRNLPGPMQLTLKETQDLLTDYSRYGSKVKVATVYPDADPQLASQAKSAGIEEVTLNQLGTGKYEVQTGMLGVAIRYADKTESIPFINDTSDLEYQITRRIRKLTSAKPVTIGLYKNSINNYQGLEQMIGTQYAVTDLSVGDLQDEHKWKNLSALMIIDDGSTESTASALLAPIAKSLGKMFILADGVSVNTQLMSGDKSKSTINTFLTSYGVTINQDLVYDLENNETLSFGSAGQRYLAPYPFWLRALPDTDNPPPILSGIKSVTLGWPSSLTLAKKDGVTQQLLFATGPNAGIQKDSFSIDPTKLDTLAPPTGKAIPLAVSLEQDKSRLVVVGDADVASDQMLQNFPENAAFLTGVIDSLATDKDLAAIPRKTAARAVYRFTSPMQPVLFQYGTMLFPSAAVIGFALFWLSRRKKRTARKLIIKS